MSDERGKSKLEGRKGELRQDIEGSPTVRIFESLGTQIVMLDYPDGSRVVIAYDPQRHKFIVTKKEASANPLEMLLLLSPGQVEHEPSEELIQTYIQIVGYDPRSTEYNQPAVEEVRMHKGFRQIVLRYNSTGKKFVVSYDPRSQSYFSYDESEDGINLVKARFPSPQMHIDFFIEQHGQDFRLTNFKYKDVQISHPPEGEPNVEVNTSDGRPIVSLLYPSGELLEITYLPEIDNYFVFLTDLVDAIRLSDTQPTNEIKELYEKQLLAKLVESTLEIKTESDAINRPINEIPEKIVTLDSLDHKFFPTLTILFSEDQLLFVIFNPRTKKYRAYCKNYSGAKLIRDQKPSERIIALYKAYFDSIPTTINITKPVSKIEKIPTGRPESGFLETADTNKVTIMLEFSETSETLFITFNIKLNTFSAIYTKSGSGEHPIFDSNPSEALIDLFIQHYGEDPRPEIVVPVWDGRKIQKLPEGEPTVAVTTKSARTKITLTYPNNEIISISYDPNARSYSAVYKPNGPQSNSHEDRDPGTFLIDLFKKHSKK